MGIVYVYQLSKVAGDTWPIVPSLTISLSLNVLLTLIIIIRLVLLSRNTLTSLGITGIGGLCKVIESCTLYAVSSLLVIGPFSTANLVASFFYFILPQVQARALPPTQTFGQIF